jgi:hypothetical protein
MLCTYSGKEFAQSGREVLKPHIILLLGFSHCGSEDLMYVKEHGTNDVEDFTFARHSNLLHHFT